MERRLRDIFVCLCRADHASTLTTVPGTLYGLSRQQPLTCVRLLICSTVWTCEILHSSWGLEYILCGVDYLAVACGRYQCQRLYSVYSVEWYCDLWMTDWGGFGRKRLSLKRGTSIFAAVSQARMAKASQQVGWVYRFFYRDSIYAPFEYKYRPLVLHRRVSWHE